MVFPAGKWATWEASRRSRVTAWNKKHGTAGGKAQLGGNALGAAVAAGVVETPEEAESDYLRCFEALYPYVDYFVVNVSSPNTPNLRALQEKEPLTRLLQSLQDLNHKQVTPKPILLKIAPDLGVEQLQEIAEIVQETELAGVIATNTTISRADLQTPEAAVAEIGAGGLSGVPVRARSTEVIRFLRQALPPQTVIIGVGGIDSAEAAREKLAAGATLVQLYSGFVYEGPGLVRRVVEG